MKNFLTKVSEDNALTEKICQLDKEGLVAAAKELGFELTEADFVQPSGELNDDELDAVAGGGQCVCVMGGGGSRTDGSIEMPCACVLGGGGESLDRETRCVCALVGAGGADVNA